MSRLEIRDRFPQIPTRKLQYQWEDLHSIRCAMIRVSGLTPSSATTSSAAAIISIRFWLLPSANGLNRNLLHLEARGSIILSSCQENIQVAAVIYLPSDIIADETEPSDARIGLHDPPQCRLGILCHRVRFIEYDELVGWTWITYPVTTRDTC